MAISINSDECIGCAACSSACPQEAIAVEDVATVNADECIECGICVSECPLELIEL